ncbi:MAG: hypothetical protein AAFU77_05225 [Myxococcota bacterium]
MEITRPVLEHPAERDRLDGLLDELELKDTNGDGVFLWMKSRRHGSPTLSCLKPPSRRTVR